MTGTANDSGKGKSQSRSGHKCAREGCRHRRRPQYTHCCAVCKALEFEMDRAMEVLPQAANIGVSNTAEQWALLVQASDAWTRYLDARRAMGRRLNERPPWSRQIPANRPASPG